jgi:hypothetical protein
MTIILQILGEISKNLYIEKNRNFMPIIFYSTQFTYKTIKELRWILNTQTLTSVTKGPFFFMENQLGIGAKLKISHQWQLLLKTGFGVAFIQNEYNDKNDLLGILNGEASYSFSSEICYTFTNKSKIALNPTKK